jgi:NADH-quinone oxidoreductase subunit A
MTPLVAYLLLFVAVGAGFILVHLLAGKLIRPSKPEAAKGTIYECGEPTIGSAWVQFDLRFYVVALLFVIFDVEVAFFFPWAEVFGKACALAAMPAPTDARTWSEYRSEALPLVPPDSELLATREQLTREEPREDGGYLSPEIYNANRSNASALAWMAFVEILVFFGVLLVGFAYLWRRGDLAWVRSLAAERQPTPSVPTPPAPPVRQPVHEPLVTAGAHH